ncbi:MAG: PA0069 family radical SAM protein [Alphaproteobacteria bacterium]|nr:PA0069 family radical SAM protein [Alphaproteobacteria bacterium]
MGRETERGALRKPAEGGIGQLMPGAMARRGRGSMSNRSGRFEQERREILDDGWNSLDMDPPRLATTVTADRTKTVITKNQSPDVPFDRSINPYRGCEHGCIYCFARPTHAFLGLSPGLDFESRLFMKPDAARLLRNELARPSYRPATIAIGTNTDPYQPIERDQRIMRQILEVLDECGHPVGIVTKSALVTRDIDILASMAKRNLVKVTLSVTTLDRRLARVMEPRASTPERRLEAIAALRGAGIPASVLFAPVIPAINDWEMERVLEAAAAAGASEAGYVLLRLPLEIGDLFREWLSANFPDRAARVMDLVRQTRGGRDYDARFGKRQTGEGAFAELIGQRFRLAKRRLGLDGRSLALDTTAFRRPSADGQLSLL